MTSDTDETAEQIVQCLVGIGAELSAIRQELQKLNDEPPEPALETYDCVCGLTIAGEAEAKRHAIEEHKAPRDSWRETYA